MVITMERRLSAMPMASITTPALKMGPESDTGVAAAHTGMAGHALQEGSSVMVAVAESDAEALEVMVGGEVGVEGSERDAVGGAEAVLEAVVDPTADWDAVPETVPAAVAVLLPVPLLAEDEEAVAVLLPVPLLAEDEEAVAEPLLEAVAAPVLLPVPLLAEDEEAVAEPLLEAVAVPALLPVPLIVAEAVAVALLDEDVMAEGDGTAETVAVAEADADMDRPTAYT
jgi:hypothetical protein